MNILLVGSRGVGKSTLIQRLLELTQRPLAGYMTKKEDALAAADLGAPVYIYPPEGPRTQTPDNLVGWCLDRRPTVLPQGFDRWAETLRRPLPPDALVVLDEIGFMETQSPAFCDAVRALLDAPNPVLAAVKDKDIPYLREIRGRADSRCFTVTPESRDTLWGPLRAAFLEQLR